jgi:hypothetical protein
VRQVGYLQGTFFFFVSVQHHGSVLEDIRVRFIVASEINLPDQHCCATLNILM